MTAAIGVSTVLLFGSFLADAYAQWQSGLRPQTDAYGGMVYLAAFLQLQMIAIIAAMVLFVIARLVTGQLDVVRRNAFDCLALMWHYAVGQGLFGLALVHGFPRLMA